MSEMKKYQGDRSTSFIDKDAARWLREEAPLSGELDDGLCLKRFHADYEAEGVRGWKTGDLVQIADGDGTMKTFEIAITGKRCFPECILLQKKGKKCPLADGTAFGRPAESEFE